MTTFTGPIGKNTATVVSAMATVATTIELDLSDGILGLPHVFVGVQQYDGPDPESDTLTVAGSGSYTLNVATHETQLFEAPSDSNILAATPDTKSVQGNIRKVKITPASISGGSPAPTHYRVVVIANRS